MFGDEMMQGSVLWREAVLLNVTEICGAVIYTYLFLSCDRFELHTLVLVFKLK
jgi:hypothetical protein